MKAGSLHGSVLGLVVYIRVYVLPSMYNHQHLVTDGDRNQAAVLDTTPTVCQLWERRLMHLVPTPA